MREADGYEPYRVTAWMDGSGNRGISIGHVEPCGWDNVVAGIDLIGEEAVRGFIVECAGAWRRAQSFEGQTHEPQLQPYGNTDAG